MGIGKDRLSTGLMPDDIGQLTLPQIDVLFGEPSNRFYSLEELQNYLRGKDEQRTTS